MFAIKKLSTVYKSDLSDVSIISAYVSDGTLTFFY